MTSQQPHTRAVSAHDVAAELRHRAPAMGVTKLHKLLYFAQGWHLAWAGEPMFDEPIEAWVNGPVVATLWADEKYNRPRPRARPLDGAQLATLDYVLDRYGMSTGQDLARLTHTEYPWRNLSEVDDPTATPNPHIAHDELRRWFQRDEAFVSRQGEVARLRARPDVFSFDAFQNTPGLAAAVTRAVNGERVREHRPS